MTDEFEVGYGKPPEHTQFKKGQSGNPKGRPKGAKNLKTIVQEVLSAKVLAKEGDKVTSVSKLEGIVINQTNKALKGDAKAASQVLSLAETHLPNEEATESGKQALSDDDLSVLQDWAAFLEILEGEDDGDDDTG
jgi:hypothetical protein